MKDKITDCIRNADKPMNIHEISAEINEKEEQVLDVVEKMNELRKVIIPLREGMDCSVYYELRKK